MWFNLKSDNTIYQKQQNKDVENHNSPTVRAATISKGHQHTTTNGFGQTYVHIRWDLLITRLSFSKL